MAIWRGTAAGQRTIGAEATVHVGPIPAIGISLSVTDASMMESVLARPRALVGAIRQAYAQILHGSSGYRCPCRTREIFGRLARRTLGHSDPSVEGFLRRYQRRLPRSQFFS